MPTLVHRGTGLAIQVDDKPPFKPLGDSTPAAVAHPSTTNDDSSSSSSSSPPPPREGGDSTDNNDIIRADGRRRGLSIPFHTTTENSIVLSNAIGAALPSSSAQLPIKRTKKIAKPRKLTKAAAAAAATSSLSLHDVFIESKFKWGESSHESVLGLVESHISSLSAKRRIDDTLQSTTEQRGSSIPEKASGISTAQSLTRPTPIRENNGGKGNEDDGLIHSPKGKDTQLIKSKKRKLTTLLSPDGKEEELINKKKKKKRDKKKSKSNKRTTTTSTTNSKVRKSNTTTTTTKKKNMKRDETVLKSSANRRDKSKKKARSPPSSKKSNANEFHRIVSVVIDRVAEEIRHCASFFGSCGNHHRPGVVVGSEEDSSSSSSTAAIGRVHDDRVAVQDESSDATGVTSDIPPCTDDGSCEENRFSQGWSSAAADVRGATLVVVAVRRFVLDVYCPYLLSAKQHSGNEFPNIDRIHLSTLLVIREMLIMNADKLFTFSNLKRSSITMRERMYLSRILAEAIVRNAAKRLHLADQPEEVRFGEKFLRAMNDYDSNSEAFQSSLTPVDARTVCTYQGGAEMGSEESMVAKVGFNYARERHPLVVNCRLRNGGVGNGLAQGERRDFAEPSACWLLCTKETTPSLCNTIFGDGQRDQE